VRKGNRKSSNRQRATVGLWRRFAAKMGSELKGGEIKSPIERQKSRGNRFKKKPQVQDGLGSSKASLINRQSFERPRVPKASGSYLAVTSLVVIVVTMAFLFHLHVRFEGIMLGYKTSEARAERIKIITERRELRLELSSLKSPKHLEIKAREEFDMEIPDYRKIVTIGKKQHSVLASGKVR
jgi:hypothetical protein